MIHSLDISTNALIELQEADRLLEAGRLDEALPLLNRVEALVGSLRSQLVKSSK